MTKWQTIEKLLRNPEVVIPIELFPLFLLVAAVLAWILGIVYVRCGTSLSNRRGFARNFVLLTVTTMLVISIVKSSLALSLGLVGALSIVRFRAAIKEPEELAYLFLCIALGLGLGAGQLAYTLMGFAVIVVLIVLTSLARGMRGAKTEIQNLHLTVTSGGDKRIGLAPLVEVLSAHCPAVALKRFDETADALEASFLVDVPDYQVLERCRTDLREKDPTVGIAFLDERGI